MGVAEHLKIEVEEYDARIRTFIPAYEELVAAAAEVLRAVQATAPTIVDLGVGTGALALRCLEVRPEARLVGIDADEGMLEVARARLAGRPRVELRRGDFLAADLPPCDAIVASLALHHAPTEEAKRALYAACRRALRPGGVLVSADPFPARHPRLAARQREAWLAHLRRSYSAREAEGHLRQWAEEDVYFPLGQELAWLRGAGLEPEVVWRRAGFAVVAAFRPTGVGPPDASAAAERSG